MVGLPPKVVIVILNWNNLRDTRDCLESLNHTDYANFEIVLVDNGSTDGSVSLLKDISRNLHMIENDRNLGFAEGCNRGITFAVSELSPDYILLLNNDTVVNVGFLSSLVEVAETDAKIGLVQSKILYPGGLINCTGGLADIFGGTVHRGARECDRGQYDGQPEDGFFYLNGACLLVSRKLVMDLGGTVFDKELFAYFEDVDLSWCARLLGYRIVYCPDSLCFHRECGSSTRLNERVYYWIFRNRLVVLSKNYSAFHALSILPIALLLEFLVVMSLAIREGELGLPAAFARAIVWNIVNCKRTLASRKFIQARRQVGDREIMRHLYRGSIELESLFKGLRCYVGRSPANRRKPL